jgi:hypothetical protein
MGFFRNRFDGIVSGATDIGLSTARYGKELIWNEESMGTPGIFGVVQETFNSVKNTFVGERGIFNGSLSVTKEDGVFNPADRARRLFTGVSATYSTFIGGLVGVVHSKTGNWIRNLGMGIDQLFTAPFVGDMSGYRAIHRNTDLVTKGPSVSRSTVAF